MDSDGYCTKYFERGGWRVDYRKGVIRGVEVCYPNILTH